jgi:glutathione S-transferase
VLTFFFAPGSSSMAPHIALHEIGEPFESHLVSFAKKEQRSPDYLALNMEGKVPTLVVDGRPLTEVVAILFYLAKRYPEAGLLPAGDIESEAHAISWMSFVASTVHSAWAARRTSPDQAMNAFRTADARLGSREWAIGRYSIADIHLFRLFWRFRRAVQPTSDEFPNLERHYVRMIARPAVQRTVEVEAAIGYELPG